jgi:glycosyltransferase involved in cell wall biosynthesis
MVERAFAVPARRPIRRLAFVVSHPIQYYAPLHRRLTTQSGLEVKVFFTWHGGRQAVHDPGFGQRVAWDIPLTEGYEHETVPNTARDPGTHHFWGLRNPELAARLLAWQPDAVHVTGYAYASHLRIMRWLAQRGLPVLFRGDSHLLDRRAGWRWWLTRAILRRVYAWPAAFLHVGQANRAYYRACGVPEARLFPCPHSIEVDRFAQPHAALEAQAQAWRQELGLAATTRVLLFVGKFEPKKCPVELMDACATWPAGDWRLLLVGDGELGDAVRTRAAARPERFQVLPFQNQSRMPLVYRLGDAFVLPSAYQETWGLAVNEALACGRPVLVSDRVGCAADVVEPGVNGEVFATGEFDVLRAAWERLGHRDAAAMQRSARRFDIPVTADTLQTVLRQITLS